MTTADDTGQRLDLITDDQAARPERPCPFESATLQETMAVSPSAGPRSQRLRRVDLSMVVPFYNEAALAKQYYTELSAALQGLGESYQIVFVDDGSTDATAEILRTATEHDPCVDVIRLPRNVGQQQATLVGMRESAGDVVVTMDADLHVDPEQIAGLLQVLRDDPQCDVASGARTTRAAGIFRRITSHMVTTLLNRMCGTRLKDPGSTFRAMRRRVVERALRNEILAQNLPLFVTYSGLTIREVPVPSSAPPRRRSSYRPSSLLMALALATLNYSSGARGLSVLLTVGGGMMLAGAALCTGLIVKGTIHQTPLPTNLLLAGLVAVVFGGQFIAFSFLGYKLELVIRNLRLRGTATFCYRGGS